MSDQKDIERELDSTGLQNATRMGISLVEQQIKFDIIITSPAVRAMNTASLIAEQLHYDTSRIHANDAVYEASVRTLLQTVNQLKDIWNNVLLVGHNPSISYLAEYLSKYDIGDMTTCGLVVLKINSKRRITPINPRRLRLLIRLTRMARENRGIYSGCLLPLIRLIL